MAGWILVHRQIEDNPIWKEKPFSKGQAWVDLLLMANHADNEILLGNNIVTIKRGQFHTSEVILGKRWGWGRKKINLFLTLLEKQKMCTSLRTWQGTTITIENYTVYQDVRTPKGTGLGTSEEQPRNSRGTQTKNGKNLNNSCGDFFDQVWGLYHNKKGRNKVSDSKKKEIESIGLEEMTRAINRYKAETKDTDIKFIQHGSTFFNKGYFDYLDANYQPTTKPTKTDYSF